MSNIGKKIYGFCNGFFGRDCYRDKVIEGEGHDRIAARDDGGRIRFAEFNKDWISQKQKLIDERSDPKNSDE